MSQTYKTLTVNTAGTITLADTLATDLLTVMGRRESVTRLLEEAPASSARDALARHLARGSV